MHALLIWMMQLIGVILLSTVGLILVMTFVAIAVAGGKLLIEKIRETHLHG